MLGLILANPAEGPSDELNENPPPQKDKDDLYYTPASLGLSLSFSLVLFSATLASLLTLYQFYAQVTPFNPGWTKFRNSLRKTSRSSYCQLLLTFLQLLIVTYVRPVLEAMRRSERHRKTRKSTNAYYRPGSCVLPVTEE